jgi:hypothetical protein
MAVGVRAATSDGDGTLGDFEAAMRGALADAAEASGPVEDVRAAAEAGMATASTNSSRSRQDRRKTLHRRVSSDRAPRPLTIPAAPE